MPIRSRFRLQARLVASTLVMAVLVAASAAAAVLDAGDDPGAWTAIASPGAVAEVSAAAGKDGGAVAFSFDLGRGKTHAIAKRAVSIDLPASYRFVFELRADCEPNTLELKFISGENVWWSRLPDHAFARDWKALPVADSRIAFAWGPAGGGMPAHIDSIEIAVSAGSGGKGTIWIDEIRLEPRDAAAEGRPPSATVSSNANGAGSLFDGDVATVWRSADGDAAPVVTLDFHDAREQGGLVLEHAPDGFAKAYVVEVSADGASWQEVRRFARSDGGIDDVYMPEVYARYVRIRWLLPPGSHAALGEIRVQPFEYSGSANGFFTAVARRAERGRYPRYFAGEQSYWTLAGVSGARDEALVNEEGSVEVGAGKFTLEPFVLDAGRLRSWNDTTNEVSLEEGYLPIPTVTRTDDAYRLTITAFAAGRADASTLYVRYRLSAPADRTLKLFVALRPFQVLPPWQALNRTGGAARVQRIDRKGEAVRADDGRVLVLTPPAGFGAAAFEEGDITRFLERGVLPAASSVVDSFGHASAAWSWNVSLEGGQPRDVWLAVPWAFDSPVVAATAPQKTCAPPLAGDAQREREESLDALLAETRDGWRTTLDAAGIELPEAARRWSDALRSNLAFILINRDGPAIQPGSRTYERSWIRDGAMTSAALLELGLSAEVKEFLRWYAGYIGADGWAPCCVDRRGADPVPEHDSFGEFIWAVAEVWRFTRDEAFVREMWPHVRAVAGCMSRLRQSRMTPEYRSPARSAYFGLLPESISHEGYSARPVHSYWDQTFALRGFADAAMLAGVAGDDAERTRLAAERDDFDKSLRSSIRQTMDEHGLEFAPASVELADFDPTSTAVSFELGLESIYPPDALERSFAKYIDDFHARAGKTTPGVGYTAYELRNATALLLLGRRQEAIDLLGALVADTRPPAWNGWPEISWLDRLQPSFLGDLPHTWIGSTFVHAVRTLLVTERERSGADAPERLLVGAGIPLRWLDGGVVRARSLPTWYGNLDIDIRRSESVHATSGHPGDGRATSSTVVQATVDLAASAQVSGVAGVRVFTVPDGGIEVRAPFGEEVENATVNGVGADVENATIRLRQLPATIVFQYKPRLEDLRERGSRDDSRSSGGRRESGGN
ncbi:MAG TPA: discoidin domain-containing protein [Candidatus Limnocylindrales bacterium]|nr:discoidin domain-containing protein [Candidatus Limnocylindrales bacterium]